MRIDLQGRRVLVIGGGDALGSAIVAALDRNGAVISERLFRNDASVEGSSAALDCRSAASARTAANAFAASAGPPELLINISATAALGDSAVDAEEVDRFDHAIRAFAPFVRRVINVVSAACAVPLKGAAAHSAHHAALASLTRALAMDLAPAVLVNALAVGAVGSNGSRMLSHSPLKRAALPEEVAAAALFLADPKNTYTTGHVMVVDGGWSAGYARNF